jgi:hypothetical protein
MDGVFYEENFEDSRCFGSFGCGFVHEFRGSGQKTIK